LLSSPVCIQEELPPIPQGHGALRGHRIPEMSRSVLQPSTKARSWTMKALGFSRLVVGATTLIVANTLIYGFVTWLPTFFVQQGRSIASSFKYSFLMTMGAPVGAAIGALTADSLGRKPAIIGASFMGLLFGGVYPFIRGPALLPLVGFFLVVSIYILVALLFGIYIPELFPTDVRMRAVGLCNTLGRTATIFTPFLVVFLFRMHGVKGVVILMIGLLVVQTLVVHLYGIEPRMRRLGEIQ
jgi:putative MFS transporter